MIGVTAFGTYVPVYRLGRNEIARAWKTDDPGGERTVAKHDEDSLTMAVAATLECIKCTPKGVDGLFFASTTPPYTEKQAATIVAAATDLPINSRTSDIGFYQGRADMARSFRPDPIYIKALATSVGPRRGPIADDFDFTHVEENVRASQMAYNEAGMKNPLKELSVAEVHDCFTVHEMILYEDLGWSPKGRAKEHIEARTFAPNGELPVNTDGGLKCFGHPLGASGLRMQYEVYKQLQEKAGPRQVRDPRLGLTHNSGGGIWGGIGCTAITGNEIDRR